MTPPPQTLSVDGIMCVPGTSLLHLAALLGHETHVRLILSYGDKYTDSLLNINLASSASPRGILDMYSKRGTTFLVTDIPPLIASRSGGGTALHFAVLSGCLQTVAALLAHPHIDLGVLDGVRSVLGLADSGLFTCWRHWHVPRRRLYW